MSKHHAPRRAVFFRQLLARLAAVLLISLAAVAGLAGPSAADGEPSAADESSTATAPETDDALPAPDTPAEPETEDAAPVETATAPETEDTAPVETATAPETEDTAPVETATAPEKSAAVTSTRTTSPMTTTTDPVARKVWVCKYAGPPGNPKLQTVISVAYNNNRVPGTWGFEDAHPSYVLAFDTGQPEPSTDDCPILIDQPAAPTWTEPTCTSPMGTYQLPAYPDSRATSSTDGSLQPGGTFNVTWTAISPYQFLNAGGSPTKTASFSHTFSVPSYCSAVTVDLATPKVTPSTACDTPWSISVEDTDHVNYAISPAANGTEATKVTATATPDASFDFAPTPGWTINPDGTATYEHTFAAAKSCLDVPAAPVVTAPTCVDDGYLTVDIPAHTTVTVNGDQITSTTTYGPGTHTVTWTADPGYVFNDGGVESKVLTAAYLKVKAATGDCVIDAPAQPDSIDTCNPMVVINNVEWALFPAVDNIAWTVDASTGEAVATATNGMTFANGVTEKRFTLPADNGIKCAAPAAPQVTQSNACDVQGSLTVPDTEGVVYALDGETIAAGAHTGPLSGTLTATTLPGFENTDADWSFDVDIAAATTCLEVPAAPAPTTPTCFDDGGLTVAPPAHTTVTVNGDSVTDATNYGPGSYTVTYTADSGHVFNDAGSQSTTTSYDDIVVEAATGDCVIELEVQPTEIDACNTATTSNNIRWADFPVVDDIVWSVDAVTGEAVATTTNGKFFGPGVTEHRFALSPDDGLECAMMPGAIESLCVGDVPYLSYGVSLPDDYVGSTDLKITFVNPNGRNYVVSGQPLSGKLLWPGASVDPAGWPGWEHNADGTYSETSGNYAWTRKGVQILFQVNPEFSTTVAYPQATSACSNPEPTDGPKHGPSDEPKVGPQAQAKPNTPDGVLPNTGAPAGGGMFAALGGLFLAFGTWLMLRDRRRGA